MTVEPMPSPVPHQLEALVNGDDELVERLDVVRGLVPWTYRAEWEVDPRTHRVSRVAPVLSGGDAA